jgi:hypothetical protein
VDNAIAPVIVAVAKENVTIDDAFAFSTNGTAPQVATHETYVVRTNPQRRKCARLPQSLDVAIL